MKKILTVLAFVAIAISANAQTQNIKTSPIALAFGSFNACYEKVISEKTSFQLSGSAFFGIGDLSGTAFGIGAGYRFYVTNKPAAEGFYIMPEAGATFGEGASAVRIGADLGYQWIWDSGFVLDLGVGPRYYIALADDVDGSFDGILPSLTLAIGYAF